MLRGPTKAECEQTLKEFLDQVFAENPNLLTAFAKFKEFISLIKGEDAVTATNALRNVVAKVLAEEDGNFKIHAIPGFLSKYKDEFKVLAEDSILFLDLITDAMGVHLHRSHPSQAPQRRHSNLALLASSREKQKTLSSSTPILPISSSGSSPRLSTESHSDIHSQSDPTLGATKDKKKRPFIKMIIDKLSPRSSKRTSLPGTKSVSISTSTEREETQSLQDEKDGKSQSSATVTEKHSSESTLTMDWLSWSWNEEDDIKSKSSQTSYTFISEELTKSGGTKASTSLDSQQDLLRSDNAASEDSSETKKSTSHSSRAKSTSSISTVMGLSSSRKGKEKTSVNSGSEGEKSSKSRLR